MRQNFLLVQIIIILNRNNPGTSMRWC